MIELPNFVYMTDLQYDLSHMVIFVGDVIEKIMTT